MSAVSTPEQGSGSRREQLLAIAASLFAEKGFKNTTVRDIADAAGILSGSLYHHFDSKESMVDEILSTFQAELFGQYDEILASADDARPGPPLPPHGAGRPHPQTYATCMITAK